MNSGSWELTDYNGNQIDQGSGNFGNQNIQSFFIENDISNTEEIESSTEEFNTGYPYPNPSHDNESIYIPTYENDMILKLFDFSGKLLLEKKIALQKVELKGLKNGIYFISITNQKKAIRNFKVIVN